MKTYTFTSGVIFNVYHDKQYCETVFPNGNKVPAIPEPNDPPFAKECGYGDRVWDLNWHHEFIHTWLALQRGIPFSPVLSYVSEGGKEEAEWTWKEEADVIAVQKKLNGLEVEAPVSPLQLEMLKNILTELGE